MASPTQKSNQDGLNLIFFSISAETLLQLGTGSMLLALVGGKAIAETLQALGQGSEEIFRGDRLPILKFPVENDVSSAS